VMMKTETSMKTNDSSSSRFPFWSSLIRFPVNLTSRKKGS
jgi:hypothetical protein